MPVIPAMGIAAANAARAIDILNTIVNGSRDRSRGTSLGTKGHANVTKLRKESEAGDTALRRESEAGDTALAQLLTMVEQESQEADEALAAHLSAVAQQQASLVRWLMFLSIGVVIAGLLAAAAILGLVITIAVLA